MSKFSNFAISFSIICILSGGINSFAQAISSVGGAGAGIGWIVGCLISGMFALSMAQIASAFPTAGGLYHWGSILGNRFWGWLTAWLNLLGLITVLGAINIGTAYFFAGTFGSMFGFTGTDWQVVGLRGGDHHHPGDLQPYRHQGHDLPDRHLGLHHLCDDRRSGSGLPVLCAGNRHFAAVDLHQLLG
jgi:amino acid transporter